MNMLATCAVAFGLAGATCAAHAATQSAQPAQSTEAAAPSSSFDGNVTLVADGCGGDRYRGPGGACHRFGTGPFPGGYYGPYRWAYPTNYADGCGPGWYRGPYGSCHRLGTGPYPGGYWGPYY